MRLDKRKLSFLAFADIVFIILLTFSLLEEKAVNEKYYEARLSPPTLVKKIKHPIWF